MSDYVRVAAIDIGSDTVHLLVAAGWPAAGGPVVSDIEQRGGLIELGRRVATSGKVGKTERTRLEGSLRPAIVKLARRGSDRVVIGATEALRRAATERLWSATVG